MVMPVSILFVYNADSGLFNTLTDIAHKIFSPETYECNLCALTYGNFAIRAEWKEFLETLAADMEFLHRDEFRSRYPETEGDLPAVFLKEDRGLTPLLSAAEINGCTSIDELKRLLLSRLG